MIEVRASASLIFKLPKPELAKAQRALKAWRDANVSTSPKPICKTNETDETKLVLNTRTSNRHAREWVRLRELRESSEICVVHYREVLRYKIYLLIRKKPLSNQFWRLRIKFDWDESLFRAVFSPLGRPTRPTIQPVPASLAMTLDGAWSSSSVRMLQVLSVPGKQLQDFLRLEDFQKAKSILLSGYAAKHIDVRFILELAAIFTCKHARLPGNRMSVFVYVTISSVTDQGHFHHALPIDKRGLAPVKFDNAIAEEVNIVRLAMQHWHPPGFISAHIGDTTEAADEASSSEAEN